jgi:phage FluMu gp28-like protein
VTRYSLRARFLVQYLDLPAATGVDDARWEHFQLSHLNDDSTFRIEDKSRQIAWSWLVAAESVANAMLDNTSSIYVSINQDEAKEKVRYARAIYDSLHAPFKLPALVRDNELGLEFESGARLLSLPATPPRGKPRFWVYLDEYAHVKKDREIYRAAVPIISKGGRVRVGSSPLGASGMFWELFEQKLRRYPGYSRKVTPWWEVQAFCTDVRTARTVAPGLLAHEAVERFGNHRIRDIYDNVPEDDFRQEYCGAFVDETTSWITWDEIKAMQDEELTWMKAEGKGGDVSRAHEAIEQLARLVDQDKIEKVLAGGLDIGRTRNTTELYAVGVSTLSSYPLRLAVTLDGVEFDDQLEVVSHALRSLPLIGVNIDQNGIGRNLAESLRKRFPAKARGVDFTNDTKTLWATDAKMLIQQRKTPLPVDRDLAYQIHSIKRKVTPSKNLVFDTDTNEKHHADKFWAWALALALAKKPRREAKAW